MFTFHPEYSYELKGCKAIQEYIEGGKGIVTLKSPTGVHRTYAFRSPMEDEFPEGTLFVYCLVGMNEWMYVGMYRHCSFHLTQASRFGINHPIAKGAKYIVRMMKDEIAAAGPMQLYHEGICSVCGRPLTNPKSIKLGLGPKCKRRIINGDN